MSESGATTWPARIADEAALEDLMTTPDEALRASLARVDGDIIVLGVGGKMGPTLAGLAKRAAPAKRVVGVARFSDPRMRDKLTAWGVETIQCDLLDRAAVAALPRLPNVVFMAGRKFGAVGGPRRARARYRPRPPQDPDPQKHEPGGAGGARGGV
ncbi:MAG: hypothetical protein OXO52_22420, partial [Rhodospirillales bacterium]|nr:hypothetical protein [Rhodospirillales bacterium]